ncbi:MAG: YwmB family TATA-box binding protein [Bacillota bacterium]|nr:YwmB family TATA-box binding protein [Bacillota bacterium]HHU30307.1 hypothetical protein [Bacillota bacterium]
MKKRKVLLLLVVFVCLAFAAFAFARDLPGGELSAVETLESLIKATGALVAEGEIQYFAELENRYWEMAELEDLLLTAAGLLQVKGRVEKSTTETYRVVDVTGKTPYGGRIHIVVQSNPGDGKTVPPKTHLLAVCRDLDPCKLGAAGDEIAARLQPCAPSGSVSYYLAGELAGKMTGREMAALAREALSVVDGRIVEGMEEVDLISYTAYTPRLNNHITAGSARFNVNIAVCYDELRDKTLVWAGFPLINTPY